MKKATFFSLLKRKSVSFLAMICVVSISLAQNPYTIQFQDEILDVQENITTFDWSQMPDSAKLENGYFGWIQFFETPTQDIQDEFRASNLQLLDYIPRQTYLFYFPESTSISYLQSKGVRAIVPVEGRFKMSTNLKNGDIGSWARQGNNILVTLQHHKNVNTAWVINQLAQKQISVKEQFDGSNNINLIIPNNCLDELSNLPYVKWVEVIVAPDVAEDTRGKSLHRSNGLDTQTSAGRNYTGVGVGVLVRDDGIVGPHIDFQGRIDNSTTSGSGGTHGDGVAGIFAGAGNLDPTRRGMAAGSDVYVSTYASSFLDGATTSLINSGTVQITNSSYGNGCNGGYTSIARTVDQQTRNNTSLLHLFSCGNSGTSNCGYGAGAGWGNITGGHKQGKNVIATANTFFNGNLVNSSSKGPATDGRIKPDIAANGQNQISTNENNTYQSFGGTSGAAPGIAGVAAQLYELYADGNGGTLPPSGLIKATLLNTANDAGNVGPDFNFGWGIVNGLRAGKLIEDNRFLTDDVTQGNSNTHTITVPSGTTQVRFMVYWTDAEATAGANPALVNDLDLVVTDPSNTDFLPWILDPTPNPVNLDTPATNGIDRLNNMEQVLINTPVAGDYDIEITGFNVPVGPQEYFVVWEPIAENLTITYPNGGEKVVPGQAEIIHWDAINTTDDFVLEYSSDNGGTWNSIATVNDNVFHRAWTIPADVSGEVLVRITSGSFQDVSDDPFNIAPQPSGLQLVGMCPDAARFSWNDVADAESYDFYMLGAKYMELVGTSSTNTIVVPIADPNATIWFSVAAKNDTEGWVGRRVVASNYGGGVVDCALSVEDNILNEIVTIYPNPASDNLFIELAAPLVEQINITVTNSLGQTLQRINESTFGGGSQTSLNISNYATGLYFVTIQAGDQSITKKLIVK